MSSLVFLLEERSARNMLEAVVPRLIPVDVTVRYVTFEGKQDLEKQLTRKLRFWREPDTRFIILRDQDSDDCALAKSRLLDLAAQSGRADVCLVRIACHELESFFLGDLAAVAAGLNMPAVAKQQHRHQYRTPDRLSNAAEELKKITQKRYQKLAGSRSIAPYLDLTGTNRSASFNILLQAIRQQSKPLSVL